MATGVTELQINPHQATDKDSQQICILYLLDRGWTKAAIARALDYQGSASLTNASKRPHGLDKPRATRLAQLAQMVYDSPTPLAQPHAPVPLRVPLRDVLGPVGAAPAVPTLAPAPGGTMLDTLDACRKDAERIRKRLQDRMNDCAPIMEAGVREAIQLADQLIRMVTVR